MNPSKKIYISLIIFGLLSIGLIVLVVVPIWRSINKDAESFISYKNQLSGTENQIKSLEKFEELYQTYQANLDKIDTLFVDAEVPINFLAFLERTGQNCQISIKVSSATLKKGSDGSWSILDFQISSYGALPNFLIFLEKLENSDYLIEIDNLSIKKLSEKELGLKGFETLSSSDINATFLLKVFVK